MGKWNNFTYSIYYTELSLVEVEQQHQKFQQIDVEK